MEYANRPLFAYWYDFRRLAVKNLVGIEAIRVILQLVSKLQWKSRFKETNLLYPTFYELPGILQGAQRICFP
jgi:hypothetical protein